MILLLDIFSLLLDIKLLETGIELETIVVTKAFASGPQQQARWVEFVMFFEKNQLFLYYRLFANKDVYLVFFNLAAKTAKEIVVDKKKSS